MKVLNLVAIAGMCALAPAASADAAQAKAAKASAKNSMAAAALKQDMRKL